MSNNISFKSYCWCIGTTSYRTRNFNLSIERQLQLMNDFKQLPENRTTTWKEQQTSYYDFLKSNNFLTGAASRPDKDAREKTSGLVDIGLLDAERNLTEVGKALLKLTKDNDFQSDNDLELPKDSYIYLKQLLKTHNQIDGRIVRPFLVLIYLLSKLEYLTNDEFTFLLPLCIDKNTTNNIIEKIKECRRTDTTYDDILISVIMSMDNYQSAYNLFTTSQITEDLICTIGINRKSKTFDKPYYKFYNLLKNVVIDKDIKKIELLFKSIDDISGKASNMWKQYLFKTSSVKTIKADGFKSMNNVDILNNNKLEGFNDLFFKLLHLFKIKSTLKDYFDLNRRYFKITDVVLFSDNKIELDILPKAYFNEIANELIKIAFKKNNILAKNTEIEDISPCLKIDIKNLYASLSKILKTNINSKDVAHSIIKDRKYSKFNKLIDEKFSENQLIDLLTKFENREDELIMQYITDNADIPTLFEYVLGIAWYIISEKKGDILEYMNLALEADLLPKTHAGGGEADIEYHYEQTSFYPKHSLLIEATLTDGTNQRRMEMEPVSRHLGEHILGTKNLNSYCTFIAPYLDINVISDFRGRRETGYYSKDGKSHIENLKIIPLKTNELKIILRKKLKYKDLYKILDAAYKSNANVPDWYETFIKLL